MKIGVSTTLPTMVRAASMVDGIREAHQAARQEKSAALGEALPEIVGNEESSKGEGRLKLESLVRSAISGARPAGEVFQEALETLVVRGLGEHFNEPAIRERVLAEMVEDPTVLQEVEELLREIAVELAREG